MTKQTIKTGTKIVTLGMHSEAAVVCRWTKVNGDVKNHRFGSPGWHIIKFADGNKICIHETSFRIV